MDKDLNTPKFPPELALTSCLAFFCSPLPAPQAVGSSQKALELSFLGGVCAQCLLPLSAGTVAFRAIASC